MKKKKKFDRFDWPDAALAVLQLGVIIAVVLLALGVLDG